MASEQLIEKLNSRFMCVRMNSLKKLINYDEKNTANNIKRSGSIHIFSNKYYSLYSPTLCAYTGYKYNYEVSGLNDYASLSGGKEFVKACTLLGIKYTIGYHVRCVPLFGEKTADLYGYGIANRFIGEFDKKLRYIRENKYQYVRQLHVELNKKIRKLKMNVSMAEVTGDAVLMDGGIVSEKHLAEAFVKKYLIGENNKNKIIKILDSINVFMTEEDRNFILEDGNKYLKEDLVGIVFRWLRNFNFYENVEPSKKLTDLNAEYGVVSSYKIRISDWKEDKIPDLCKTLISNGFQSVTFDPRFIEEGAIDKTIGLFVENGIIPIPLYRKGLPRYQKEEVNNNILNKSMMAMVGNSISTYYSNEDSIFSKETVEKCPDLLRRIEIYADIIKST